jgi:hypothetical protein
MRPANIIGLAQVTQRGGVTSTSMSMKRILPRGHNIEFRELFLFATRHIDRILNTGHRVIQNRPPGVETG